MVQFYVSITEECNLACEWCFWRQRNRRSEDAYDLDAVLATIRANLDSSPEATVVFYGGEPTLRPDRIRETMSRTAEEFPEVRWRWAVQTNGTRLSELLDLADRLRYVSVSVNHNTVPHLDWDALNRLRDRFPIVGRMTYDGTPLRHWAEPVMPYLTHLYWQLVQAPRLPFTPEQYSRELDDLLRFAAEHPHCRFVPLDYAWQCQFDAKSVDAHWFPCGVGGEYRYIGPSGKQSPCDELAVDYSYDDIEAAAAQIREYCQACDLRPHCRGRCPAMLVKFGRETYEQYCPLTRLLFEKVRTANYAGQPVDEIGLQTEVMH